VAKDIVLILYNNIRDENEFLKVASQMSDQLDGSSDIPPVNKPYSILL